VRVAVVHNDRAGRRAYSTADLVRLLGDAGHEPQAFTSDDAEVERAVRTHPHAVIAAGGDGTVATTAIALRDSPTPLFILPTGTSNNIARAVGSDAPIPTLIAQLETARDAHLDLGRITGDAHERWFVEAAGIGFIGAMLREDEDRLLRAWRRVGDWLRRDGDRGMRVGESVADHVRHGATKFVRVEADGEDLSGEYVAVEIMNIAAVGPRVLLAANADPGDARLDLVLVRDRDREALARYIATPGPAVTAPPLVTRAVRRVALDWPEHDTHVDAELWPRGPQAQRPRRVVIDVPRSVNLLVPRNAAAPSATSVARDSR
jgi:diacylglycerol kinase (ATP)